MGTSPSEGPLPVLPLLSHELPLDSMFIAPRPEQSRVTIKPRIARWCSPSPATGRTQVLPDLQRRSLGSATKLSSQAALLLTTRYTKRTWGRWQNTRLGAAADAAQTAASLRPAEHWAAGRRTSAQAAAISPGSPRLQGGTLCAAWQPRPGPEPGAPAHRPVRRKGKEERHDFKQ